MQCLKIQENCIVNCHTYTIRLYKLYIYIKNNRLKMHNRICKSNPKVV